ncbi:hypothetical protein Tco_0355330 [Tanacetum coccineum]
MMRKWLSPQCVENKARIAPPPEITSKEKTFLLHFAHKEIDTYIEQIFWSIDNNDRKWLRTSIVDLKAQLEGNLKVVARSSVQTQIVLDPGITSTNNTQKHGVHQKAQQSNVQVIPSTGGSRFGNQRLMSDNSLNTTKQIWQPKGKLSDKSLNKTKRVWKATGKLFTNVGYQWRPTGMKFTLGKLNCGYQWRPTGKKFPLGELCPLTRLPENVVQIILRYLDSGCSKLYLEEGMAPVRISSGPEPMLMFGQNSSSLVLHQMMSAQISSSLGLHCQKTFKQISSNLVSQMSQRRLLASLQAPFLKEKKGVRFSALYLQQKRNLLVLDHSHQQVSYFFHARSVVKWINVDQLIRKGNLLLDLQKLQKNPIFRISVDIRQNTYFVRAFTTSANVPSIYIQLFWNTLTHDVKTGVYSFQVNEHWLTLSADLLRKALNVTPADSAHPFESPPAGKTDITEWLFRWIIASQDETTGPSVHPEDATSTKMVRETLSHADAESGGNSEKVGSNSEQSHVALAGPNPEHMHDVFLATNYPKVHESLKHTTKEHVHLENPPSSSRTLSSMKNLEDS